MGPFSPSPDRRTVRLAQGLAATVLSVVLVGSILFAAGAMYSPEWLDESVPGLEPPTPTPRPAPQLHTSPELGWVDGSNSANLTNATAVEQRIYAYINAERVAYGREPFIYNPELAQVARNWSRWRATTDEKGHVTTDGIGHRDRAKMVGYECDGMLSENVAGSRVMRETSDYGEYTWTVLDDPDSIAAHITRGFAMSKAHRSGMLSNQTDVVGIGVYITANDTLYVTEMFCERSGRFDRVVNASKCPGVQIAETRAIKNESMYPGFGPPDEHTPTPPEPFRNVTDYGEPPPTVAPDTTPEHECPVLPPSADAKIGQPALEN